MEIITVQITRDGDGFVSHCLDYDIASQGQTLEEAKDNIVEAVSVFLEYASPDEIQRLLKEHGHIEQLSVSVA